MNRNQLVELMTALDLVVLQRSGENRFRLSGDLPEWLGEIYPQAVRSPDSLQPGRQFPFLEHFLEDAEAFWNQPGNPQRLRSGIWLESHPSGANWALQATAVKMDSGPILLIERVQTDHREKQMIIQKGRELSLDYRELERMEQRLRLTRNELEQRMEARAEELALYNTQLMEEITERMQTEQTLEHTQRFLQNVFDAIQDGITVVDRDRRIVKANRWMEQLYAQDRPLVGKYCYQVFQNRATPCEDCPACETLETGKIATTVLPYPDAAHPQRWLELATFPLKGSEGTVEGVIEYFKDITLQHEAQAALEESEQRYRALFEDSPISLWEADASEIKAEVEKLHSDGFTDLDQFLRLRPQKVMALLEKLKMVDLNNYSCRLYGASDKQTLLDNWQHLLPPNSENILREALVTLADGRMIEMEFENRTLGGEMLHVLIRSLVPPGYENTWSKIFISIQDLTERVRAEKTRKSLENQLQRSQKLEAIGTLAGGIAHDFNNILSAIIGYTELAKLDLSTDDPVQAKLDQVYLAGSRAKDLVKQILAFSRQAERKRQIVQISLIVKEAMKLLRSTLPATIEIKQRIKTHAVVKADPSQIYQVVMNLCTNAYQAMGETGGMLAIELEDVALKAKDIEGHPEVLPGPHVRLAVVDTGQGIDAEVQDRIFDPYFTTKEKSKGTGLGLAVVHGIIKSLGGMITVNSEPQKGSRFEVYLPVAELAPMEQSVEAHAIPGGSERILFVDDEKLLAQMGQQMLIRLGYQVTALTNSEAALKAFENAPNHFDLVITDMTMPKMTGLDLARQMLVQRPDLPVILCSGMRGNITPDKAAGSGIRELITKPVTMKKLAEAVRRVLE